MTVFMGLDMSWLRSPNRFRVGIIRSRFSMTVGTLDGGNENGKNYK